MNLFQGVTSSYSYFGMHGTCFPMHTEDMDLGSVSFLHWGKSKVWIIVAEDCATKLENAINETLKNLKSATDPSIKIDPCNNIMRHKDYLVTPEFLEQFDISYTLLFQQPGEFIITFPRGYHEGFNLGPNIAEAVNFGNEKWVSYGCRAVNCSCKRAKDLLKFNMDSFLT
jgi:jumonji domain-containing protein 2